MKWLTKLRRKFWYTEKEADYVNMLSRLHALKYVYESLNIPKKDDNFDEILDAVHAEFYIGGTFDSFDI